MKNMKKFEDYQPRFRWKKPTGNTVNNLIKKSAIPEPEPKPEPKPDDTRMTVGELIDKLSGFPEDYKVKIYEEGSVYDWSPTKVLVQKYDLKNNNKVVTITNSLGKRK